MNRLCAVCLIIFILPLSAINAETSLNSELTRCAAIKRDLQRLVCYDALSGVASSAPVEALSKKSTTLISKKENTQGMAGNTETMSTDNTQPTKSTNEFGLPAKGDAIESISSYIPGEFKGWKNGDKLTLANGQIWKIKDSNGSLYHLATNPRVTISKGMFSSYRITIEGVNKSVSVKRIK